MGGTVLILGGSGKIGQHASRAFAAAGWTVRRWTRGTDMTPPPWARTSSSTG